MAESKKKKPVKNLGWLKLGKTHFNMDLLNGMSEKEAIKMHGHIEKNRVINAWKRANGKK